MNEVSRARWGKAGHRLTAEEAAARDRRAAAQRNEATMRRDEELAAAHQLWRDGRVVPHLITLALDSKGLDGLEVDEACHAKEPDVDRWEKGELYPTWEQVIALAELTGVTPRFFMERWDVSPLWSSTLRFHVKDYVQPPRPVLRFLPGAVTKAVGGAS